MINLSDRAAQKVQDILKKENKEGWALRVGVINGGCSGFKYSLDFDQGKSDNDQVYKDKGIKILIDSHSAMYLIGAEVDYQKSLTGSWFTFSNPNATKTCGCVSSFKA
jgi:iron-sulfur cluster assembly accessory protein